MKIAARLQIPGLLLCGVLAVTAQERWTAERANAWEADQPWLVGCNFLPSTAVNDVEMWQRETFAAATLDRELGWAQELGFNAVRVFINYAVWEADAVGLKRRFGEFLSLADRHGIRVMPVLFDDCFKPEPQVGRQDDPLPGVHNSQWVSSPGESRVRDTNAWPRLEQYVKEMVGSFGQDRRIVIWDLYNEPTRSLELVEATFRWARQARPSQPLTTCVYGSEPMRRRIPELCDLISFHNYSPLPNLKSEVARLRALGRPVLCTEWMARPLGSRFETQLPFFKENRIGCWNWGLVAGRTQTYFPWGAKPNTPEPTLWFHDILRRDGTPFNQREVRAIKIITGKLPGPLPQPVVLAPTAEHQPVSWRYTFAPPASDWFKPRFDDASWQRGPAPFGREEAPIARKPNTVWTNADLWIRREFAMPPGRFTDLALRLHHDEDTEVFINGVKVTAISGFNAAYDSVDLGPDAQAALKPGRNLMAVHCHQTTGGQYLDVGLEGFAAAAQAGAGGPARSKMK